MKGKRKKVRSTYLPQDDQRNKQTKMDDRCGIIIMIFVFYRKKTNVHRVKLWCLQIMDYAFLNRSKNTCLNRLFQKRYNFVVSFE